MLGAKDTLNLTIRNISFYMGSPNNGFYYSFANRTDAQLTDISISFYKSFNGIVNPNMAPIFFFDKNNILIDTEIDLIKINNISLDGYIMLFISPHEFFDIFNF